MTPRTPERDDAALSALRHVAQLAALQWDETGTGAESSNIVVSLWDMEMRYLITSNGGLFIVQSSDRGTAPWLEMASEDFAVAARGLILMLASRVRRALGHRPISNAQRSGGLPQGVVLAPDIDGLRLSWGEGAKPSSAWFPDSIAGRSMAARFAHVARNSVAELVESIEAPDGSPLWSGSRNVAS